MVRYTQSIDGFVTRPQRSSAARPAQPVRMASPNRPIRTANTVGSRRSTAGSAEEQLLRDIESSLSHISDIDKSEKVQSNYQSRAVRRQAMEQSKQKPKKRLSKGKLVKRIIIILFVLVIGVVGYLAVKAMLAGGKIFNGNPIAMLTTKTRLAEDTRGRTNILVFGTSGYSMDEAAWEGAMLTDSIMVVSIDQDDKDAYMMSLPRDLYVKHTCPVLGTPAGKLNETFYCGYAANKDEKAGAQALMNTTGEILGLDMHYYVHADWTALVQLVDAVGGVDVTIESSDPRGIYDSGTNLRYQNGEVAHLNGEKALALARARNHNYGDYGLAGGNYDREKNQQKILAALQQKALSAGTLANPVAVNNMIDSLGNNLITSFDASHVQTLMDVASGVQADKIKQLPLVGRQDDGPDLVGSYTPNGQYLGEAPVAGVYNYEDIQAYIAKYLSSDPVIKEGAIIDVLNGSDQAGLAATKADELKADDFTIGQISNAPELVSDAVVVYQRNSAMTGTADALKEKLGVDVKTGELFGYTTTADFVVVYGASSATSSTE